MKRKKGFSLIEILVSIVLVSTLMVSMTTMLVKLKKTYSEVYDKTDLELYEVAISSIINKDLIENDGIKDIISCSDTQCTFVLGNNEKRILKITEVSGDENNVKDDETNKIIGRKRIDQSSLEYIDNTNTEKLLYIKTLKSVVRMSSDASIDNYEAATGYKFGKLETETITYDSIVSGKQDEIVTVKIEVLDSSSSEKIKDICLYTSGTY